MSLRTYRLAGKGLGDTFEALREYMKLHSTIRNSYSDEETDWMSYLYPHLSDVSGALRMQYIKNNESITVKIMSRFSDEETNKILNEMDKYGFVLEEEKNI